MTRLNLPVFVALAASILSAVPADGSRDTLPHQRMIRKRGPGPIGEGAPAAYDHGIYVRQAPSASNVSPTGVSSTPAAPTTTSGASSTAAAPTTTTTSTSTSSVVTTSEATSTVASTTGGLLDSLTSLLNTSSSTVISTSTTPPTSSAAPTTSSTPSAIAPSTTAPAPSAPAPTLNIATASPTSTKAAPSEVIVTSTIVTAAEASQSAADKKKKITQNTIISLVVVAACIGGAIAIWTVIRKWKFSPSEKFDDRMQPIDWAPQGAGGNPEETMEEKRHRRAGSSGSHGSFTSAGAGKSENGHANGMYADSQHSHTYGVQSQDFPPAHDFTAGATGAQPGYGQYYGGQQYAGGAGYADLQRGPSMSESTYSQGANVSRGLSYSRGPVAGYEAQPGAAGVPPLPNPYGGEYGYDDYAPQTTQPHVQAQTQQAQVPYRGYN